MTKKDYNITLKVKNNLLLEQMRMFGYESGADLSRASGVSQTDISEMLNLKANIYTHKTDERGLKVLRKCVKTLCNFFSCCVEDIYPERHLEDPLKTNSIERALNYEQIKELTTYPTITLLEDYDSQKHVIEWLESSLDSLTDREKDVLCKHYGIKGEQKKTLTEISKEYDVSLERIRQIEQKAMRRLRTKASADQRSIKTLWKESSL